jgi:hypothetical protein
MIVTMGGMKSRTRVSLDDGIRLWTCAILLFGGREAASIRKIVFAEYRIRYTLIPR